MARKLKNCCGDLYFMEIVKHHASVSQCRLKKSYPRFTDLARYSTIMSGRGLQALWSNE